MAVERQSQTADYSRSGRSWFVSQSGSLPPRFSSLIRLNLTSGPSYSSKPQKRFADRRCWSQQNGHPISQVPQKWKICEGKTSGESKNSFSPAPADCKADLLRCSVTERLSLWGKRKISRTRNGERFHLT